MNSLNNNRYNTKQIAAIYCRVSTEEQASKDDNSLEVQESILRKYCQEQNLEVFEVYVDQKSGKSLDRPEMKRLRSDARIKKFNCIVATKIDRLSRSVKDFLDLDYELQKAEVDIKIQSQNFDTTTPSGRMLRMMLMAFAEFERDMISERTAEAAHYRAKEGLTGGGLLVLGYKKENKLWVVDVQEADLVRLIFELYQNNPSTSAVAMKLNELGYKTKQNITKSGKITGGGQFTKSAVHAILTQRKYLGLIEHKGNYYQGKHERIISDEVFKLVQELLNKSKTQKHITKKKIIPLALGGMVYCGFCGKQMTPSYGTKDGKKYYYYKCTTKNKDTSHKCNARTLKSDQLENFIYSVFNVLANDDTAFESNYRNLVAGSDSKIKELQKEERILLSNLATNKGEINNLSGVIKVRGLEKAPKTILEEIDKLEVTVNSLKEKLRTVQTKLQRTKVQAIDKDTLQKAYKNLILAVKDMPFEKKKLYYGNFIERITSNVMAGSDQGEIAVQIKRDGEIIRKWADLKKFEFSEDEISNLRKELYPREDSNLRPAV